ncbi:hypothetical protein GCM10018785_05380 [Streptomyces longispororuber]|uniref:Uncharacterized protein n=1 Tax=Streptomyces longispororuber TaxID=68230 RepID=A0A918Z772_9ACTN|nr:hypothetical protein GCM10018785_05380 [Streptomyces longispororuber]
MARIYATSAQYEAYTGQTAPADFAARLARTSRFLEPELFRLCWYDVRCARKCSGGRPRAASWGQRACGAR